MGTTGETDIVVIGSGITGFAAALTAAEGGAKVILFEKQLSLGGTSNFFEGIFAVESKMQREAYIAYSRDEAFKRIMEYSHWRANARLVRAIVNESADTIAWLQRCGVEFTEVTINIPDAPRTYHVPRGIGAAVMKVLAIKGKELGIDLRLGTSVKRILKGSDGIAGVVAERDGQDVEVSARAVVIASGGYANNREWIKKYTGFDLDVNMLPLGNVDKMGDGIRMAWEVGADEEGVDVLEMYRIGPMGPDFPMKSHLQLLCVQPLLWVDAQGERFCDECQAFNDTSVGNISARHREGYTYTIFDNSIKNHLLDKGVDKGMAQDNPPGTRPVNFDKEFDTAIENGSTEVFVADSIEELAGKMGADRAIFKATVEQYNGFCAKGHDDLFAKAPKYLMPLKEPKFYAIKGRTLFLGTLGGIKINHNMEVVDKKGRVIPGLYAGGFDAGGMWGDSYSINDSSGLSSAFAANSGRIAGRNAAKYVSTYSAQPL